MSLAPGNRLGPYEILAQLGEGGMGEVYKARDPRLGRDVAIKVLPSAAAADLERRARFEREAKAGAALNHPNVVTVHAVEEAEGVPSFTMEYVEGRTLAQMIPSRGLPLDDGHRAASVQGRHQHVGHLSHPQGHAWLGDRSTSGPAARPRHDSVEGG